MSDKWSIPLSASSEVSGGPRRSVSERVAEQLREAIYDGAFASGDAIPTELELSERLNVSRSSTREALRMLEAQGLLRTIGRRQSRVVAEAGPVGPLRTTMNSLLKTKRISMDELQELRLALEVVAVRSAAADPAERDFRECRAALERMRRSLDDIEAFDRADAEFHEALIEASENELARLTMAAVAETVSAFLAEALNSKAEMDTGVLLAEHEAILEAVEAGDRQRATILLARHIERKMM